MWLYCCTRHATSSSSGESLSLLAGLITCMHALQADRVSAVSEKLKFSNPVKTGTTGILPKVRQW